MVALILEMGMMVVSVLVLLGTVCWSIPAVRIFSSLWFRDVDPEHFHVGFVRIETSDISRLYLSE